MGSANFSVSMDTGTLARLDSYVDDATTPVDRRSEAVEAAVVEYLDRAEQQDEEEQTDGPE